MMRLSGRLQELPNYAKWFVFAFLMVLSVGYFTGLQFVRQTDSHHPDGIETNYLGNEDVEEVTVMKFEKSEREMLTILHTHVLSISFIFFFLGTLIALTSLPRKLKTFLMIEPFFSILLTFGGIYFMWKGMIWLKWLVMVSGILMTVVYVTGVLGICLQLIRKK